MADRSLQLAAPAKLNLFLHVTGRRADGYHLLQTVFQLVDLCDEVTLEAAPADVVAFTPGSDAPGGDDDLCLRAARALQTFAGVRAGVRVTLRKHLPMGGGLGGGSSDAATVLLGLNRLWGLELPIATLMEIGTGLGADVPVFVGGRTAWAQGVGEQLTPLDLPPAWYVIIKPDCAVHTGEIFSHRELTRDSAPITMHAFFAGYSRNDCQPIVRLLYPEVDNALNWLRNFGNARLTGTGACVFCQCDSKASAQRIAERAPARWEAWVAAGLNQSPAITEIESVL
jgi:4-diphosphocytidyl-2-C-methyl-D-erythritol kinase